MTTRAFALLGITVCLFAVDTFAQRNPDKMVPPALEPELKTFFVQKQAQARALAKEEQKEQAPEVWEFFRAGENGDWTNVARIYRDLQRKRAEQKEGAPKDALFETMVWQPLIECHGAYEQGANMEEKYVRLLAREILESMPRGSILFGGNDAGRWIPTAFSKAHTNGDPCFVLSQNSLADSFYLKYVRGMYGRLITVATEDDAKKALEDYKADAGRRFKEGKLRPGEDVTDAGGNIQVTGHIALMQVNARIARTIFDANPRPEFFVVETFPLDWMNPHLSPHGLIMKLNREPLKELPTEAVQKDAEYWTRFVDDALGKWLRPTTSVDEICHFATRVFAERQMDGFGGDARFVGNSYASRTCSKLRSSIAGVYAWRAMNSTSAEEKKRMNEAADFAFRQAYALCPSSVEALYRYINLLAGEKRFQDGRRMAQVTQILDPGGGSYSQLISELNRLDAAEKRK